jgi:hypothetical protein
MASSSNGFIELRNHPGSVGILSYGLSDIYDVFCLKLQPFVGFGAK